MAAIFSSPERTARKAERERMYAAEAEKVRLDRERAELQRRRDYNAAHGYSWTAGRVGRLGGYGIWITEDGAVTVGDPKLGESLTTQIAGAHASLETLAEAHDRVTAGRVLALGLLALAVPKRDPRRLLVITAPGGFEGVVVVDGSTETHLRQFVASFNRLGAGDGQPGEGQPPA